jgi:hypothetical protein
MSETDESAVCRCYDSKIDLQIMGSQAAVGLLAQTLGTGMCPLALRVVLQAIVETCLVNTETDPLAELERLCKSMRETLPPMMERVEEERATIRRGMN